VSRNNNDDMALITVPVPPQRLGWLYSQLDASGIPYQDDGRGNVTTLEMAQPIVDQVLGYQAQRPGSSVSIGGMLYAALRNLLPVGIVAVGIAGAAVGFWGIAAVAALGAIGQRVLDARMETAYRAAEAVGDRAVRGWRIRNAIFDLVGLAFLLAMAAGILGVL
jgi:hypothetical protein